MTPSSILKGTAVLLFLQGVSTVALNWVRTIEDVCDILIEKMGMLFLPAGVSILLYLDVILAESTAIVATVIISSFMILIVTAVFLNFMLKSKGGAGK